MYTVARALTPFEYRTYSNNLRVIEAQCAYLDGLITRQEAYARIVHAICTFYSEPESLARRGAETLLAGLG